jgi:hypothetical protein
MAYIVSINNEIHKIAANDSDKNNLNCDLDKFNVITISDSDFNNLKLNIARVTINGTSAVVTLKSESSLNGEPFVNTGFQDRTSLDSYLDGVKTTCKSFLDANSDHIKYSEVESYYNYLSTLDTSTITYPTNCTWEEYCNNNSIPFLNPLQIP